MNASETAIKLLVYSSRLLFQSQLCVHGLGISDHDAFNAFIYKSSWNYLSDYARNRSNRLPPFHSIYNLHLNRALFGPETEYLLHIQSEHQFIVWDPHRIEQYAHFRTNSICFHIHKMIQTLRWFVFDSPADFDTRLRIEFALKVLNETKSLAQITGPNEYSPRHRPLACYQFCSRIVRFTVYYLWTSDPDNDLLERFLIGLIQSHGFDILFGAFPSRALNSFIRILRFTKIKMIGNHSRSGYHTVIMAKAVYWWFIQEDNQRAEYQLKRLCLDGCKMPTIFDFEYLEASEGRYRSFDFIGKWLNVSKGLVGCNLNL